MMLVCVKTLKIVTIIKVITSTMWEGREPLVNVWFDLLPLGGDASNYHVQGDYTYFVIMQNNVKKYYCSSMSMLFVFMAY